MSDLLDYWFAFECVRCAQRCVLDVRVECAAAEVAAVARRLEISCPACSRAMSWEGSWPADAYGYGSRSSDLMKILSDVLDGPIKPLNEKALHALEIARGIVAAHDRELEARNGPNDAPSVGPQKPTKSYDFSVWRCACGHRISGDPTVESCQCCEDLCDCLQCKSLGVEADDERYPDGDEA